MPVDAKIRQALELKNLDLPVELPVVRIEVEDYVNWYGDDALRITVILDDNTTDEQLLNGKAVSNLKRTIRESLLRQGVNLFPYTFIRKEHEVAFEDE